MTPKLEFDIEPVATIVPVEPEFYELLNDGCSYENYLENAELYVKNYENITVPPTAKYELRSRFEDEVEEGNFEVESLGAFTLNCEERKVLDRLKQRIDNDVQSPYDLVHLKADCYVEHVEENNKLIDSAEIVDNVTVNKVGCFEFETTLF